MNTVGDLSDETGRNFLPQPATTAQARWVAGGLWLLVLICLALPWTIIDVRSLSEIDQIQGDGWWFVLAILLVSGFNLTLMALADTYAHWDVKEEK